MPTKSSMPGFVNPLSHSARFALLAILTCTLNGCRSETSTASSSSASANKREIPGVGYAMPAKVGKYEVLDIITDNKDLALAKSNPESALIANPDIACMVGLWAYNPPAILSALENRGLVGKIAIVGFDETSETLSGITDGKIYGTVAQQPYRFGYKSVEYLAAMARQQPVSVPDSKLIYVPHTVVTADNIQQFKADTEAILAGNGPTFESEQEYDTSKPVKLALITNSIDPFWVLCQKGVEKANPIFNAECRVAMPSNATVEQQKTEIEQLINNNGQGLAISPINGANQVEMINQAADKMPVICQDADSPNSNRDFYIGTNNYMAGRDVGKLIKRAIPEGGKVVLFVGKLEVTNAQERSRGVIDELADKPIPPAYVMEQR